MKTNEFIYWWDTDTHFLGVVKYLTGVDTAIIWEHGRQAKSATQLLRRDTAAVSLRTLCQLRAKLRLGHVSSDIAIEKLKEASEASSNLFGLSPQYTDATKLLEAAIYYVCPKVIKWFPPCTSVEMVRTIFSVWPDNTRQLVCDSPSWVGGSACLTEGMIDATTDAELFTGTALRRWVDWPFNTLRMRNEGFGEQEVNVVVDGENVTPGNFYIWANEMISRSCSEEGADGLANVWFDVVCNKETVQIFDFILDDLGLPGEVHTDHRVLDDKSTVDFKMYSYVFGAYYREGIRNFILVSSDSDFWALPSELPDARFRFVVDIAHRPGYAWKCMPNTLKRRFEQMDTSLAAHNNFAFRVNYLVCCGLHVNSQVIVDSELWDKWVNNAWGYTISHSRAAAFARQRVARIRRLSLARRGVEE